jgi:hypothetical protein
VLFWAGKCKIFRQLRFVGDSADQNDEAAVLLLANNQASVQIWAQMKTSGENPIQSGGPKPEFQVQVLAVFERVAMKSLATGNFGWFTVLVIILGCIYKLSSAELKEVLTKLVATFGWLGYFVGSATIWICVVILKWRERFYQEEIARMTEVRNQAMQAALALPLQSSQQKGDTK